MTQLLVNLLEWETRKPEPNNLLWQRKLSISPTLAEELSQSDQLQVLSLEHGLQLRATSWVGRVTLDDLTISIKPKIQGTPFLQLLRYAYGLRNLALKSPTQYSSEHGTFQELVAHQLALEVEELIAAGLQRDYQRITSDLSLPRGRIDFQRYVSNFVGGFASLPCIHYPRAHETILNRVLLAGLLLGARLVSDGELQIQLRRLAKALTIADPLRELNWQAIDQAQRSIDRRTRSYQPALNLIALLMQGKGVSTLESAAHEVKLPGFLFDMNRFFQALLSRFLHENLIECRVIDEFSLKGLFTYAPRANPLNRKPPMLRPDFLVLYGNNEVRILDAKYRDLWEHNLPIKMLYQLAIYALSHNVSEHEAIILYPTLDSVAKDQRIVLNKPLNGVANAQVVLRPVNLLQLEELVRSPTDTFVAQRRKAFANELVFGGRKDNAN